MNMKFMIIIVFSFLALPAYSEVNYPLLVDQLGKMAGYGEEKLSTVIVHGTLLCRRHQSCVGDADTEFPVAGASVAVFCGTSEGKVKGTSWAKNITDEGGEFVIDLPSQLHSNIPNLENSCKIQVLHLPKESLCYHHHSFKRKQYYYKRSIKLTSNADGIRIYTAPKIQLKVSQRCTNKIHMKKRSFIML